MFLNLMAKRLCLETLSELLRLFGFDIIDVFQNCFSVRVPEGYPIYNVFLYVKAPLLEFRMKRLLYV